MNLKLSFREVFRLLCWEGAFALAFETWIGSTYLSALAGEVGISVGLMGLLAAAPWIGSVGQISSIWVFEHIGSVKQYTVRIAAAARAMWLIPLFLAIFWWHRTRSTGEPFPTNAWFTVTAAVACFAALLATSSAASWQSWMLGLVPTSFRGRFFGHRQRFVMGAVILAHLVASLVLGWRPHGIYGGYLLLGFLGIIAASSTTYLLAKVPDIATPSQAPAPAKAEQGSLLDRLIRQPLRNREFRRALTFGALFHGAVLLAAPYFPYYLTKEMEFTTPQIAFWSLLTNVGMLLASSFWGRMIDSSRRPEKLIWIGAHAMALAPLPYLVNSRATLAWLGPLEYFSNGFSSSGYSLGIITLLFRVVPKGRNAAYFSLYTAACGVTGALASLLGSQLAHWLAPWGGFRALFALATAARLLVLWFVFRALYGVPQLGWRLSVPAWLRGARMSWSWRGARS